MDALLLVLLDSRAPAGGHNHSAGMEAAIATGLVHDLAGVEEFCRVRLHTAGRVAAAFAAAACRLALAGGGADGPAAGWDELSAELDARTPSAAQRAVHRQLGRGLARLVRAMLPSVTLPPTDQHPLVLGAAVAAAGGEPDLAAQASFVATVSAPASGAVRLLGLDPFAVHAMLARLVAEVPALPAAAGPGALPADTAPLLDLLADVQLTAEVRLFAS